MANGVAGIGPAATNRSAIPPKKSAILSSCYVSLKHGEALALEGGLCSRRADVLQKVRSDLLSIRVAVGFLPLQSHRSRSDPALKYQWWDRKWLDFDGPQHFIHLAGQNFPVSLSQPDRGERQKPQYNARGGIAWVCEAALFYCLHRRRSP